MEKENPIYQFMISRIDRQIEGFNKRRHNCSRANWWLSNANMVGSAAAVALISVNIKFNNTYVSLAAVLASLTAALAGQMLQYFKYQERLQLAVSTTSQLQSLKAMIDFEATSYSQFPECQPVNAKRYEAYFSAFQRILNDANQAWSGQLGTTIQSRTKGATGVSVQSIQS